MRILVIEDSRLLQFALNRMLTKAGHQVVVFGDGHQGLIHAQHYPPDLILLDMMLPTLEGTSVLRCLKRDPLTNPIPVVVVSGLSQKNEEKLRKEGAAGFLEKSSLNLDDDGRSFVQALRQVLGTSDTYAAKEIAASTAAGKA